MRLTQSPTAFGFRGLVTADAIKIMTESEIEAIVKERSKHWEEMRDKHFPSTDDLFTIAVKGHLLLEQALTTLLSYYFKSPQFLIEARLNFSQKVLLAKAMILFPFPSDFLGALNVLNQIRNDFSHELEPKKLEDHLKIMRILAEPHRKDLDIILQSVSDTDSGKLKLLISFWLGFLNPLDSLIKIMEVNKKYG
jgi:hypothetical protein